MNLLALYRNWLLIVILEWMARTFALLATACAIGALALREDTRSRVLTW